MAKLIEQLKELRTLAPRKEWVAEQREILLSRIAAQTEAVQPSFAGRAWLVSRSWIPAGVLRYSARPLGLVSILAVLVLGVGMFGVNASKGSLPGDLLYPVKLTTEKVRVSVVASEEKQAELYVGFAEERVKEIETVAQQPLGASRKAKITTAANGLKNSMIKAQGKLDAAKQNSNKDQQVVTSVQKVDDKSESISARLEQKKLEIVASDKELDQTLTEAKSASDQTSVKAIEVIIDKHSKGETQISDQELVGKVEQKINKAQAEVKAITPVTVTIKPASQLTVVSAKSETASTGDIFVQKKPSEALQILSEAQDMLRQGDLSSAIEKVQQGSAVTQEIKQNTNAINTNDTNSNNANDANNQDTNTADTNDTNNN